VKVSTLRFCLISLISQGELSPFELRTAAFGKLVPASLLNQACRKLDGDERKCKTRAGPKEKEAKTKGTNDFIFPFYWPIFGKSKLLLPKILACFRLPYSVCLLVWAKSGTSV